MLGDVDFWSPFFYTSCEVFCWEATACLFWVCIYAFTSGALHIIGKLYCISNFIVLILRRGLSCVANCLHQHVYSWFSLLVTGEFLTRSGCLDCARCLLCMDPMSWAGPALWALPYCGTGSCSRLVCISDLDAWNEPLLQGPLLFSSGLSYLNTKIWVLGELLSFSQCPLMSPVICVQVWLEVLVWLQVATLEPMVLPSLNR